MFLYILLTKMQKKSSIALVSIYELSLFSSMGRKCTKIQSESSSSDKKGVSPEGRWVILWYIGNEEEKLGKEKKRGNFPSQS